MLNKNVQGLQLPIEWVSPEDLISRYVNNIVVQHTEHEFIISFFETFPPVILGTPEEQAKQLETITSVRSKCVARLLVHPDRMGNFINALQTNYQNYLAENRSEESEA